MFSVNREFYFCSIKFLQHDFIKNNCFFREHYSKTKVHSQDSITFSLKI